MKSTEKIEHITGLAVRSICQILSPSCIGCPSAKVFISADRDVMRDGVKTKINVRCEKTGMTGPVCPDRGQPGETYLKDLGVTRRLGEQQLSKTFNLDHLTTGDFSLAEVETLVKSSGYLNVVNGIFKQQEVENDEILHEMDETLRSVVGGRYRDSPIVWSLEHKFKTLHEAKAEYLDNHVQEYRINSDAVSGRCKPTVYMETYFPKEYRVSFGIRDGGPMVPDRLKPVQAARDESGDVTFFGDEPQPGPEPTHDEIYEDWGSFA